MRVASGSALVSLFHISFIYLFIHSFIHSFWLCWVFVSVRGLSRVAASGGHSSSRCAGLSLSRPLLLRSTGSRCAGSVVVAHGPSRSVACGILPDQGLNPCSLHQQADSQPLRHQGSPTFLSELSDKSDNESLISRPVPSAVYFPQTILIPTGSQYQLLETAISRQFFPRVEIIRGEKSKVCHIFQL